MTATKSPTAERSAMTAFSIPAPVIAGIIGVNIPATVSRTFIKPFLSSFFSGLLLSEDEADLSPVSPVRLVSRVSSAYTFETSLPIII